MTNPYLHPEIPWTTEAREIADWVTGEGLRGTNELELLEGLCERLNASGVSVTRAHVARRTLHPLIGAYASQWRRGEGVEHRSLARESENRENWLRSPFVHMIENRMSEYRSGLEQTNEPLPFPVLEDLRGEGATEYAAFLVPWGRRTNWRLWKAAALPGRLTPRGILRN